MKEAFRRFANRCSWWLGSPLSFVLSLAVVVLWGLAGPVFHYSDGWQLFINTTTTVLTFLMVFIVQATQNRDAAAIHLKLDELIRSSNARNTVAGIEAASEEELQELQAEFERIRQRDKASLNTKPPRK